MTTDSSTSTTYRISSGTRVQAGPGRTLSVSDLAVGERVHVRTAATGSSSGSSIPVAAAIDVHLPHLDGTVTAVGSGSITITDHDGFTRTLATSSDTTYSKDGVSAGSSVVTTGARIHAEGRVDSNGTTLDASRVDVVTGTPARPAGPVGDRGSAAPGGTGTRPAAPTVPGASASAAPTPAAGS